MGDPGGFGGPVPTGPCPMPFRCVMNGWIKDSPFCALGADTSRPPPCGPYVCDTLGTRCMIYKATPSCIRLCRLDD